ncbi:MAG: 2-oxoacid:acceptor oxidoreductase family protein [Oscillospiraceae bacterium]|jgi:2-oxoglutarate ferredoxin oxidoreductase subunit gamma|nr:2-oxoacid:acceptor oxidoreductase family protein [Oscillospiraceae bacterium]
MHERILIAGFGGQGILFAGKFLVYANMLTGKEVSWLPSYGPEMRGGTANCSVILSDTPIGSPIVDTPDILIAMNLPSLDKFEGATAPGGRIFVDSALITRRVAREDVTSVYIPATQLADTHGLPGLANMVMLGKVIADCGLCRPEDLPVAMGKVVPERKRALFDKNIQALQVGAAFPG